MLWNKKDPAERTTVKEYWKATDTVSRPMAIALTLLIGFICLAVTFSLFMGGRWVYNNLSDNDKKTAQTILKQMVALRMLVKAAALLLAKPDQTIINLLAHTASRPHTFATKSPLYLLLRLKKQLLQRSTSNSALPGYGP